MHIRCGSFESTAVEGIISMAKRLELDTICISSVFETAKQIAEAKSAVSKAKSMIESAAGSSANSANNTGAINIAINILIGAEISAKSVGEMHAKVDRLRDFADIIIVLGGEAEINRAACENPKVDVLAHPELKRKDSGIDHVMAAQAAKNKVAIELNFRCFLNSRGKERVFILSRMRRNAMLAHKFNAPLIAASGAENVWEMRAGRELATLAYLCGTTVESAISAVSSVPEFLVNRVSEIKGKGFVMPGVRIAE